MSLLTPTNFETLTYNMPNWSDILNTNWQTLNADMTKFNILWDGSATDGKPIKWDAAQGKWVAVYNPDIKHNYSATTAPTATDDSSAGYSVGSRWIDTIAKIAYTCVDATVGAAVWYQGGGGSGDMSKAVYDTNDNGIVDNAEKAGGYLPSTTVAAGVIPVTDSSGTLDAWVTSSGGGVLNNFTATTAPTVTDDSNAGYAVGSRWIDTTADIAYECVDATAGAAIWQVIPTNTNQVTEGTTNLYYTEARVSANADVAANTANRHTQNTDTGTSATEFYVDTAGANVPVKAHIQSTSNPHSVTASQVGINSTDDVAEGTINLYDRDHFAGKTQDDLPDGTTYKQYNPANVAITGGSITGTTTLINAQTGTAYTLVLSDSGKIVTMNNASANTVTVPASTTTAFSVGTKIMITQTGAGSTTIAADTGVTIDNPISASLAINEQYGSRVLVNLGTDLWLVV